MKRILVIALVLGVLLTGVAMADETNVKFNIAARYYPATFSATGIPDYQLNAPWLEANIFAGKNRRWKGSFEWFQGNDSKNVFGVSTKLDNRQIIGRIGYDVWQELYATVSYKHNRVEVSNVFGNTCSNFKGFGIGLEKYVQLDPKTKKWPMFAAVHYYPTLDGPNNGDFHAWEYEIGVKYKWPKAVDISVGYRGESWNGFNNASNTDITISGPYIGISKEF